MRSQERMWPQAVAWAVTMLSVPMIAWAMVAGYHPAQLPLGLAVGSVGVGGGVLDRPGLPAGPGERNRSAARRARGVAR